KMFWRIVRQRQRYGVGGLAHEISLAFSMVDRASGRSDFSAGNGNGLSRDGAGTLTAQPEHGIGDFRRRYKTSLRIVFRQLGDRLLTAAAGLLHDVVNRA